MEASDLLPSELRCEYLRDPQGIDVLQPRLSWVLVLGRRGARAQRQTAYQVLVATSRGRLDADEADLWDTGRVTSSQSIQLRYQGAALHSGIECFWKVRIWDQEGSPSAWSGPAHWTMGLLTPSDWHAKWIGRDLPNLREETGLTLAQWIGYPESKPQISAYAGTRFFRRTFLLEPEREWSRARLLFTADDSAEVFINGGKVGSSSNWRLASDVDVTSFLKPGWNVVAASSKNAGSRRNPAGFILALSVIRSGGPPVLLVTDSSWKTSERALTSWKQVRFNESGWVAAQDLGPMGIQPWGMVSVPGERRLPARFFRREFVLDKKPVRAVASVSGLGLFELQINGRKIGDQVLSPGLIDYSKRVPYLTFDVTDNLRTGTNAVGMILGNGRFYAPRIHLPTETVSYGFPKLLLQIQVHYQDGTSMEVISDERWKVTTEGPIRANNEYDGEEYDARLELPGWSEPGFDDSGWQFAQLVQPPAGVLSSPGTEPIRVIQPLPAVALTEPKPGNFLFDFGQNTAGWCRLKVSGPRGAQVIMRYAETLKDGTACFENLRSAQQTDAYILKGEKVEAYEPRFVSHGFRYVEVTGYPGKPDLSSLEARVVHDDLERAGVFDCSNPLLNRIFHNLLWSIQSNYRSIPTDCPQRDERQGWLGDRAAVARGECYLFNTAAFYSKWLKDIRDAQKPNGSLPDVCPAYWPLYADDVAWPSTSFVLPGMLHELYGDTQVVQAHYPSLGRWMDYMSRFITNGIVSRDSYGDWCAPPESPNALRPSDSRRKTRKPLLATAFFYQDLRLMMHYADLLGLTVDERRFALQSEQVYGAFNRQFFRPGEGQYDNGSQTSFVLPLAFGLVPSEQHQRVFESFCDTVHRKWGDHIGTGMLGCQWFLRVLSNNGRTDLAYAVATQKTYPGWGYMVGAGATTMWELWNGNTVESDMNSANHVMLGGDLITWFYEYLAGIKPDPAQPGFRHIVMQPQPVSDLSFVRASHHSPYGLISSEWHKGPDRFVWRISIPPNTTATVCVPAVRAKDVFLDGEPALESPYIQFLKQEAGRAIFRVASGDYQFESR